MNNTVDSNIANRFVLFSLSISLASWSRVDKRATKDALAHEGAEEDSGRLNKYLLPKTVWKPLTNYQQAVRRWLEDRAIAVKWVGEGTRMVPTGMALEIAEKFRTEFVPGFYKLVNEIFSDSNWDAYMAGRQKFLGAMFNPSEYPASAAEARAKYKISTMFAPVPQTSAFAEKMHPYLVEGLEDNLATLGDEIREDIYGKLKQPLTKLVESLKRLDLPAEEGKGGPRFHGKSIIGTLKELVAIIPQFNLGNDPQVEDVRREVMARITRFEVDTLKEDADVRKEVVDDAEAILRKMGLA